MAPAKTKRRKAEADAFEAALKRLESAADREEALVAFLDDVLPGMGRLQSVSQEMVILGRIGLSAEQSTEYLAGPPQQVMEPQDLRERGSRVLAEQSVAAKARRRLFEQPMLSGSAVAELLGSKSSNPRQYANDLRKRGDVVGLQERNRYVYPAFQFDIPQRRVRRVVVEVNRLLDAASDPWGVASWWMLPHGGLEGGAAPADLLDCAEREAEVVGLARIEREPLG